MSSEIVINTCGACSGNPAVMGIGGIIIDKFSSEILHDFSLKKGTGTNNEAQYWAIIQALQWIIDTGITPQSIVIQCDSHLVICQCLRNTVVDNEKLMQLNRIVHELIKKLGCRVEFIWTTAVKNTMAQALAFSGADMPFALIEESRVIEWEEDTQNIINGDSLKCLPEINPQTALQISLLNSSGKINSSCLVSLLTYGMDKYSRSKINDLLKYIEIRFGRSTRDFLIDVLADSNDYYSKNVLRWVARGLKPTLAFVKARIDTEIKEDPIR